MNFSEDVIIMKDKQKKVKVLDNDFYRQQVASEKQKKAHSRKLKNHRLKMRLIYGVACLVTFLCLWSVGKNLWQTHLVKQQTVTAQKNLNTVKKENEKLKIRVKQLNDNDYLEKLIRERYYYSRDNETVYNLPEDKAKSLMDSGK